MSAYPPEHHVLRDLRFATERLAAGHVRAFAPSQPGIRADDGSMRIGAIAMLVDVGAAAVAIVAADPDWSATADLAYWTATPIVHGPVICDARLVRAGSGVIVVGADIYDGDGREELPAQRSGHARLTFARIPASASRSAGRLDRSGQPTPRQTMSTPTSNLDEPLFEKLGLRFVDDAHGIVECPKTDYVRNSFGTINGGVMCAVFEAAAERTARHATGVDFIARDLQVHYLTQTKVGPARTDARVLRADATSAVVELRMVDAGHDDTVLCLATVSLSR